MALSCSKPSWLLSTRRQESDLPTTPGRAEPVWPPAPFRPTRVPMWSRRHLRSCRPRGSMPPGTRQGFPPHLTLAVRTRCLPPAALLASSRFYVCLSRKNVRLPVGGGLCVHPVSAAPGTQCVLNEHVNEWGSPSESCRVTNEPLSPAAPVPRFGYGD